MKSLRIAMVPFLGSLALVGCGSSGGDGTVNETAAKAVSAQLISAVTKARTGSDGPAAAFALAGVGQSAQGLVTVNAEGYSGQASGEKIGAAHQKDVSGSAECTETGCTFKGFADSTSGAAWTIDGSLSWAKNKFTCDLTMTGDFQGQAWTFHEVCDLTVTDTSIEGTFATDGKYSLGAGLGGLPGGVETTWDSSITFTAIKYNANGCATSGSIEVEANYSANGYSSSGSGSVTFTGSGC